MAWLMGCALSTALDNIWPGSTPFQAVKILYHHVYSRIRDRSPQ
jgi:hypothetical protein